MDDALESLLGDLRKSQRTVIRLVVEALASLRQAASISIALVVAQRTGSQVASALIRFYRLLHNPRIDDLVISRRMLTLLGQRSAPLLLALDWTEWHSNLRVLSASAAIGTRAIPVYVAAFLKSRIVRSQNAWEESFLEVLCLQLREAGVQACFLADRGFRRVAFLRLLLKQRGQTFVVRLAEKVAVEAPHRSTTLRKWGLGAGQAVDLGWVKLRQHDAVEVRVVGLWQRGAREPWWLATNTDLSLARLAALYDRRMAIEEQFRDTKGCRFGFALVWTQLADPEALARFLLLIGVTIFILTAVGAAIVAQRPDFRLPCKIKGPRLSLFHVAQLAGPAFVRSSPLTLRFVVDHLPPPALRDFAWLHMFEKAS
jgi:hypothetical protein